MSDNCKAHHREAQGGFSLLEMMVVVVMILILSAIAIINLNATLPQQEATAAMNAAEAVFRQGRDSAIAQRRAYQLVATAPNQLDLVRWEVGNTTTPLPVVTLPAPAQFMMYPGIPDTPDGYGPCSSALCFPGSSGQQWWLSDGTFADVATGNPLNATIFIAVPGSSVTDLRYKNTQRAFTILGTTGRIRAYKWTGGSWVLE